MAEVSLADFFAAYHGCTDKAYKAALEAWLRDHYQQKRPYRSTAPLPATPGRPPQPVAGKRSLDHFFDVICHESRWHDVPDRRDRHDLLRKAIIHFVTASPGTLGRAPHLPRLRRAAKAWQPGTSERREFKRLMLAEDLQPLARYQLTPSVTALVKTLQDWLHTNWYQRGEVMFNERLATKELTHG